MTQTNSRAKHPPVKKVNASALAPQPAAGGPKRAAWPPAASAKAARKGRMQAQVRRRAAELRALLRDLD
jgi:hypothetical protein